MPPYSGTLFSHIHNRGVFSAHWLEHRLEPEPDWKERADEAADALTTLAQLWAVEKKRVDRYGNEQGLEVGFIQPVMKVLGWKLKYQTHLHGREPDYALFLTDADLDAARGVEHTSAAFWTPAAVVADAKKWDLPLDKKLGASGKKEYPPEQIEWYLDRSRKDFGILTNGKLWRLVPRELGPHQRRFQTYYEVNLAAILDDHAGAGGLSFEAAEDFRRFFLFFGPVGYVVKDGRKPLVRRAVEGSSEYRLGVSEGLKEKAFEALRIAIEGCLAFAPNDLQVKGTKFAAYTKAVEPFRQLADLWTADAAGQTVDAAHYADAAGNVDRPKKFTAVTGEEWFTAASKFAGGKLSGFHWDLAFPEVFCDDSGPVDGGGFDAVIGNPPYEVLSEKESGVDPTDLKTFVGNVPTSGPAVRGKQNLYKLFICRALDVLRDAGRFGFIVPMPLLGDDQAVGVRRHMVKVGEFTAVEAFPHKDNPKKRVFADAKLSTTVFGYVKGAPRDGGRAFRSRVHPENWVVDNSPSLMLRTADVSLYDPDNFTIASCGQEDWDLAVRLIKSGRMVRLRQSVEFFQGEVNETNARAAGQLTTLGNGKLVVRGAGICRYVTRHASQQGEHGELYLDVDAFLKDREPGTKAFHHKHRRIGWQESSPQNNFRRIIAASIPAGEFCNHTVNYLPEHTSRLPLEFVLGLLNSTLADWYFRLGSTNAHVSHYQLYNLPCPHFRDTATASERVVGKKTVEALAAGKTDAALSAVSPLLETAPFSPVVQEVVVAAVERIITAETNRGEMSRSDRSALSPAAQPFQDILDAVFFKLAGLTPAEVAGLRNRYEAMKKVK